MGVPFEPGAVDQGWAADGYFADGVWQGRFGADGAEEGVPACEVVLEEKCRDSSCWRWKTWKVVG